jgi:hypothetical protein
MKKATPALTDKGELQKPGRIIDIGLRVRIGSGPKCSRPCATVSAERRAVSGNQMEVDPQVQKGEDKGGAKHRTLNRKKRPEDSGVVELPHPQPFLYITRDTYQDKDE